MPSTTNHSDMDNLLSFGCWTAFDSDSHLSYEAGGKKMTDTKLIDTKRVRQLEVLIGLQQLLVDNADQFSKRSELWKLGKLKFEYYIRAGHDFRPPYSRRYGGELVPYGNN